MRWQHKLTKTEVKHLRDNGVTTLKQAQRTANHQAGLDRSSELAACHECNWIMHKLSIQGES
jgi:hypothetical protein